MLSKEEQEAVHYPNYLLLLTLHDKQHRLFLLSMRHVCHINLLDFHTLTIISHYFQRSNAPLNLMSHNQLIVELTMTHE